VPQARPFTITFPLGGLDRQFSIQGQPPFTTAACLNVYPIDTGTGRARGGVRPVLKQLASTGFAPYHWRPISYLDTTVKEGILLCNAGGTYSSLDGVTWTERIATNPASSLASCAVYNGMIYQASSGANTKQATVLGTSEANLSNAGGGTAPTNCGIVWVHQDRLALAAKSDAPHQIFMSAVGDATNWDYTDNTAGGAWTNTGSEGGQLGHAVIAALNHNYDISLIGSVRSIYAVLGNPRVSGTRRVSDTIGPLNNNCWCKAIDANGDDSTFLLSYDGLYMIPAGDYSKLVKLSKNKIPVELTGTNPAAGDVACIGFDNMWSGLYITINPNSGSDVNYFYHIPTDSYWPLALPITPQVYATFPAVQTSVRSSILPISSGGSVRQFDNAELQGGSNESIDSYLLLGPIRLSDADREGMLVSLTAALATGSEAVNWEVYCGDTAEEAYTAANAASSPNFTGTAWTYTSSRHFNYWQHPRVRGAYMYLRIADVSNERWLIEEIIGERADAGRRRVG
jgi:hypothetical protein